MRKVIRISGTTYKRLESLTTVLGTPEDIIKKLIDSYEAHSRKLDGRKITTKRGIEPYRLYSGKFNFRLPAGKKAKSRPRGQTPCGAFYRPIFKALADLGGKATDREIFTKVEKKMKPILRKADYKVWPLKPNVPLWKYTTKLARWHLARTTPPLLNTDSQGKIWEITEAGRKNLHAWGIELH